MLPESLAADVVELSRDDRFKRLWAYFKKTEAMLQAEINEPSTPKDHREMLVYLRQKLNHDIIGVVEQAINVLEKKAQYTNKGVE